MFIQTKMRKRVYKTSELPRMDQQTQLNWEFRSIDKYCAFLIEVPDQSRSILARGRSCNNRHFNGDILNNDLSSEDRDNCIQQRSKERKNYRIINVYDIYPFQTSVTTLTQLCKAVYIKVSMIHNINKGIMTSMPGEPIFVLKDLSLDIWPIKCSKTKSIKAHLVCCNSII